MLHSYLPPLQKTSEVTQALFGDTPPHLPHIQVTETNCVTARSGNHHIRLFFSATQPIWHSSSLFSFCQYCLAFGFVSLLFKMVLDLLLLLFPCPHFFHAVFLSFHGWEGICHSVHLARRENFLVGGEKERVFTLVPFPRLGREE